VAEEEEAHRGCLGGAVKGAVRLPSRTGLPSASKVRVASGSSRTVCEMNLGASKVPVMRRRARALRSSSTESIVYSNVTAARA
jgi:hypothetical protein